ncbi:hypothetical protein DFH06DRAFT_1122468 [Mycena polygramma]|nr:hypothetical protein DFH06DRAFT_1122468 [Mycena polygramma]
MKSYTFPPETSQIPDDQYADVEVIDISGFHLANDPLPATFDTSNQADLVKRAFKALREVGFLAINGHGLCSQDFHHQFDLARMLIEDVGENEKHRLHAEVWEGSWAGYKPTGYYRRPDGGADTIEHFDNYPFTARASNMPDAGKPYVSDIRSFFKASLGQDALWDLHHRKGSDDAALDVDDNDEVAWNHSKEHLRYAMYHSQPIAGLQVRCPDGNWRYIRHYPEHIIVNLGDSLEFLTGGLLKAVPHRGLAELLLIYSVSWNLRATSASAYPVSLNSRPAIDTPPSLDRLAIFYFVPFLPEVPLRPLASLIAGHADDFEVKDVFEEYRRLGGQPETISANDWYILRSKLVGTRRPPKSGGERVPEDKQPFGQIAELRAMLRVPGYPPAVSEASTKYLRFALWLLPPSWIGNICLMPKLVWVGPENAEPMGKSPERCWNLNASGPVAPYKSRPTRTRNASTASRSAPQFSD